MNVSKKQHQKATNIQLMTLISPKHIYFVHYKQCFLR